MKITLSSNGRLPRLRRLRRRRDFQRVQGRGQRGHATAFTVVAAASPLGPRLGCAVSRKVGNAVVRNRVRRLIKEMFRRLAEDLPAVDIVVIAKPNAAQLAAQGLSVLSESLGPAVLEAARRAAARAGPLESQTK